MREEHPLVAFVCAPTRDQIRNTDVRPDWELGQWPFSLGNDAQPTHQGSMASLDLLSIFSSMMCPPCFSDKWQRGRMGAIKVVMSLALSSSHREGLESYLPI